MRAHWMNSLSKIFFRSFSLIWSSISHNFWLISFNSFSNSYASDEFGTFSSIIVRSMCSSVFTFLRAWGAQSFSDLIWRIVILSNSSPHETGTLGLFILVVLLSNYCFEIICYFSHKCLRYPDFFLIIFNIQHFCFIVNITQLILIFLT